MNKHKKTLATSYSIFPEWVPQENAKSVLNLNFDTRFWDIHINQPRNGHTLSSDSFYIWNEILYTVPSSIQIIENMISHFDQSILCPKSIDTDTCFKKMDW